MAGLHGQHGATVIFIGTTLDINNGDAVCRGSLEYYPRMAKRRLQRIVKSAMQKWSLLDTLLIQRVCVLQTNDHTMMVAVWSAQRMAAFATCRLVMEALKAMALFWECEETLIGSILGSVQHVRLSRQARRECNPDGEFAMLHE
jgi:molybdopterin synthase catalytic subunit